MVIPLRLIVILLQQVERRYGVGYFLATLELLKSVARCCRPILGSASRLTLADFSDHYRFRW